MKVLAALAIVAALVAGCASSGGSSGQRTDLNDQVSRPDTTYAGVGLVPPLPRPAFTLTDTSGARYSFSTRTAGRATMLFFGYTNCPDICPATMADIGNAVRSLPAATQKQITVAFVTTDVKHDTGPVIASWLKNFSPDSAATFVGLRGTQAQIEAAQAASHVNLAEDGGRTHSTQVLLFGPDDYAHVSYLYNGSTEEKQMAHDLPIVVKNGRS